MWFNRKNNFEDYQGELNARIENLETDKKYLKNRTIELIQENTRLQETIRNEDYKIGGLKVTSSMAKQTISRYRKQAAAETRRKIESQILKAADKGCDSIRFGGEEIVQFIKSNVESFENQGFDVELTDIHANDRTVTSAIISWREKSEFEKLVDKMGDRYVLKLSFTEMNETEKLIAKYIDEIYKTYNVKYDSGNLIYTKR